MEVYFSLSIKPGVFVSPLNIMRISREPFHMEPYKLSIKTWRFHKIISDFNPFFLIIIGLEEQHSDETCCGVYIQIVLLSKRNWQLNRDRFQELNSLKAFDSQYRSKKFTLNFKFFIGNFLNL